MMPDSFWFGVNLVDFLLPGFQVNSVIGLLSVCFGVTALVILHESLKVSQGIEHFKLRPIKASPFLIGLLCSTATERSILLEKHGPAVTETISLYNYKTLVLYMVQLIIGYLLMLIVMTYNVYLMIAIIVGAAIGHFIFGSLLLHITAQTFLNQAECNDCQVSTDGYTTPVIEVNGSGFDSDSLLNYDDAGQSSSSNNTVTVEVHCKS